MNTIDLFAGAGGLSEGFRQAGYNIIAHVEMDKQACLTLKTREVFYYLKENNKLNIYIEYLMGRISRDELYSYVPENYLKKVINKEITNDTIESIFCNIDKLVNGKKIDIIIGGPPCQAYSIAGRSRDPKRMADDPRNYLYKHYIKFLERYRPKMFVFENVQGILSAKNGEIFEDIRCEMKKIGYEMKYEILNAKDFGVLQSRKRVIIIGWEKKLTYEYPRFKKVESDATIKSLFEDLPTIEAGESLEPGEKYNGIPSSYTVKNGIRNIEWEILTQHIARSHRDVDRHIYEYCIDIWDREGRKVKYNELPKELITHKNTTTFLDRFKVIPCNGISHTIVAHICKDGHYYIHPDIKQRRSITVREAARIQSFPDDYFFEDSRTAAFKQIGNSVPPLMAKKIANVLLEKEVTEK